MAKKSLTISIDEDLYTELNEYLNKSKENLDEFAQGALSEWLEDALDLADLEAAMKDDDGVEYSLEETVAHLGIDLDKDK
ncbi:hypothetical protein [Companilactobacillus ginsenosidimutans]|uniref:CopG family transcriptional regulator n=1 Tax=Companilactobacillus ginsenosidimutans TaxID=1007676 RepID=A0A0H4QJP2_9LACO|nr:hypothetical protein [Companilactobacillus ginsenosidimutans]AKP67261.1 hypothetical protein ABM34_06715 [Companilactobacillus ginsenosidimutans]